jgi:diguanylate cyclase (GGDEF)-like protein/PAS domain S-box-containing protein
VPKSHHAEIETSAIRAPGRAEARAVGTLLMAGAGLVWLSLVLPHPGGADTTALLITSAAIFAGGLLCRALAGEAPLAATHAILAATSALTALLIVESGVAVGQYGTIFVWEILVAAYFFPRHVAAAHLGWLLACYAGALALVGNTSGYSPMTRWVFSAVSLSVVMLFTSVIVARRARADDRARHFFDLSQDMLSTLDTSGRCIEASPSWARWMGYTPEDLRGVRLLDLAHPDDREEAVAAALRVFEGKGSVGLETRVRAKDGSWHWLRSSSALSADEELIYARSTDVTELKQVEAERERLLGEVEGLARSDPLTGLPNRRALDEQMPRELARARRAQAPLCLAVIDLDRFKDYNDANGHLAGDRILRECAVAWDGALRGEDLLVRFGGEEFLVVLPSCSLAQGAEIVERLRSATPAGQTCSVGLACWDFVETAEELLGRADAALYEAKESGRDRLVAAMR